MNDLRNLHERLNGAVKDLLAGTGIIFGVSQPEFVKKVQDTNDSFATHVAASLDHVPALTAQIEGTLAQATELCRATLREAVAVFGEIGSALDAAKQVR